MQFKDFEVASISLHGAEKVSVVDVDVNGNNKNVEVLGLWSSLRFILPYVDALPENYQITVGGQVVTQPELEQALRTINDDVIYGGNWESKYPYLVNESGVTDGNVYGLVINQKGVAVNGLPDAVSYTHLRAHRDA